MNRKIGEVGIKRTPPGKKVFKWKHLLGFTECLPVLELEKGGLFDRTLWGGHRGCELSESGACFLCTCNSSAILDE